MLSVCPSVRACVRDIMLKKALEESQRVLEDLRVFREGIKEGLNRGPKRGPEELKRWP